MSQLKPPIDASVISDDVIREIGPRKVGEAYANTLTGKQYLVRGIHITDELPGGAWFMTVEDQDGIVSEHAQPWSVDDRMTSTHSNDMSAWQYALEAVHSGEQKARRGSLFTALALLAGSLYLYFHGADITVTPGNWIFGVSSVVMLLAAVYDAINLRLASTATRAAVARQVGPRTIPAAPVTEPAVADQRDARPPGQ